MNSTTPAELLLPSPHASQQSQPLPLRPPLFVVKQKGSSFSPQDHQHRHILAMPRACCCTAAVLALALLLPTLAAAAAATDYRRVAPSPGHECGGQGTYAPNSTYEANLRRLAANVPAQANASSCRCSPGNVAGERPDMVAASVYCYWRPEEGWSSDCGACITRAFREAQRLCPYHRQAMVVVDGGECSVSFHDVQQMEQSMGLGSPGQFTALDGDNVSFLDFCLNIKELTRYMSEHEKKELKNFTGQCERCAHQVLKSPRRLIM